jgi:hypothetical protein
VAKVQFLIRTCAVLSSFVMPSSVVRWSPCDGRPFAVSCKNRQPTEAVSKSLRCDRETAMEGSALHPRSRCCVCANTRSVRLHSLFFGCRTRCHGTASGDSRATSAAGCASASKHLCVVRFRCQHNANALRIPYDVFIGDDISRGIDDYARADHPAGRQVRRVLTRA